MKSTESITLVLEGFEKKQLDALVVPLIKFKISRTPDGDTVVTNKTCLSFRSWDGPETIVTGILAKFHNCRFKKHRAYRFRMRAFLMALNQQVAIERGQLTFYVAGKPPKPLRSIAVS